MRKTLFIAVFICGFIANGLRAQDVKQMTYGEADFENVVSALGFLNVNITKVNLPVTVEESFKTAIIIEEYKNSELINTRNISLLPTMEQIKYPGETEFRTKSYDHITFVFNAHDPDNHMLHYVVKGVQSGGYPLIRKSEEEIEQEKGKYKASYHLRPFAVQDFTPGEAMPVFLYGSMWLDEKYNIYRFCGSKEVDAAMEDELFKLSPHYFVIKLKLDPNPDYMIDTNK